MAEPLRPVHVAQTAPAEVVLNRDDLGAGHFTPNELAMLKAHFGRSFSELVGDETSDDKFVALAWIKLRRLGHKVDFDQMGDTVIIVRAEEREPPADPTAGGRSTSSPASAATGE
jgi:hypothetical protein